MVERAGSAVLDPAAFYPVDLPLQGAELLRVLRVVLQEGFDTVELAIKCPYPFLVKAGGCIIGSAEKSDLV